MIDLVSNIVRELFYHSALSFDFLINFLPMLLVAEMPLFILVIVGNVLWFYNKRKTRQSLNPSVSIIITCYGEGESIRVTIDTLVEQIYPGKIEILAVVDGAIQNKATYEAAMSAMNHYKGRQGRVVRVVPKWQRGGRVSTLNSGLFKANNEIVINVDGDTSFDNDMVAQMVSEFANKDVIASGGALRVRNWKRNILTRMQALEYMISMQAGKTGTSQLGFLNNISGAFGAFRKKELKRVGGWDTHTAEDLDLTFRLKQYASRYKSAKLAFTPHAVGHTDVPETTKDFISQRLRWDGDLLFLYLRKHVKGLTPNLLGWKVFLYTLFYGVLQNVLLPMLVTCYTVYIFVAYPLALSLSVFLFVFFIYFAFVLFKFLMYLLLVSERQLDDAKMLGWLVFYPLYALLARYITSFSLLNELFRRSHEESNMAPWWVLKKGKKF